MRNKSALSVIIGLIPLLLVACPPINSVPPSSISITPTVQEPPTATIAPTQNSITPTSTIAEVKITVRGVGLAPNDETDPARRKRAAIRAAELEADRIFAQWQAGVQLDSVTVSKESVIEEDKIRESVKASMRILRNTIEEQFDNVTGEAEIVVEYIAEITK